MLTEGFLCENQEWIRMLTGLKPKEFRQLFQMVERHYPEYERERRKQLRPHRQRDIGAGRPYAHPLLVRVLALLTYLRLHLTQELTAALFGMHQPDISRDLRRLLPLLQQYLPVPVLLPLDLQETDLEKILQGLEAFLQDLRAFLDAMEQTIERPKDKEKQQEYYSGKKKRHTVKTQIIANSWGEVAAITPAVPGKTSDITLARRSRVVDVLPEDTDVYDDKGYVGLEKEVPLKSSCALRETSAGQESSGLEAQPRIRIHTPTKKPRGGELTPEQKERNREIGRIRVLVEHVIGWLRNWRILSERFRCALELYTEILRTVAGLVNFQRRIRRQAASA